MSETLARIPPHLRRFVVEQDTSRYTPIDHAVWRFVLLQMYDKLQHTAHPAYAHGLNATGISVERIPSLREMDRCLSRVGWGAVAVDGFIPPRAFTEFQALGLLPICAEIRTADHLVYTPAPDIIHEAAGHAPIVVDPKYADYLRRIGEVGARAFRTPEDDAVYDAIFTLSEVKEEPGATASRIQRAEASFERARAKATRVSEATRVSRLYWWTAEYGLVGTPEDYKLYGAGLLSSLGESHSCHDPAVKKLPLSPACADVDYDITRAQPQLFVAADFDQLMSVLSDFAATLAYQVGGARALKEALASEELCTLTLDSGLQVIGRVEEAMVPGAAGFMLAVMAAPTVFARRDRLIAPVGDQRRTQLPTWIVFGKRRDGSKLTPQGGGLGSLCIELGEQIRLTAHVVSLDERLPESASTCRDLRLIQGDQVLAHLERGTLLLAPTLSGARAGAADPDFYEATDFSGVRAPKPRSYPPKERAMIALYQRALAAHTHASDAALLTEFQKLHSALVSDFPHDWLLRWNMLESLVKRSKHGPLTRQLRQELTELEHLYEGKQPIASGLTYLGFE